ncbi:head maturation protease, ClpP-related [Rhodoligotrophos ferricapiens]|uniref:head maturation protease, ClpP-related n=1 Tax=Rhodoligotrophos ferricapiens TaxID=3069264 RepID=UPI00315D1B5B
MDILVDGELYLYGTVGDSFWDEGFTSMDVVRALAELGRTTDVTVHINSGGGIAFEGSAIYNALAAHAGKVTVIVESIAASAASLIAMAGEEIIMRKGAIMMIHDPSMITIGNSEDHQKSVAILDKLADSMADIYAEKTGRSADEIRQEMRSEIWLEAEDAVAQGYADRLDEADAPEPTAFDYRLYQNTPERIVALADARAWSKRGKLKAAPAAPTRQQKDRAIMTAQIPAELNPAATNPTTPLVETKGPTAAEVALAAAEIAEICTAAGVPQMTATLIKEGVTPAEARIRADTAKQIRATVDLARTAPGIEADLADQFIAQGASIEQVRAQLFEKIATAQQPTTINTVLPPKSDAPRFDLVADMKRRIGMA